MPIDFETDTRLRLQRIEDGLTAFTKAHADHDKRLDAVESDVQQARGALRMVQGALATGVPFITAALAKAFGLPIPGGHQ